MPCESSGRFYAPPGIICIVILSGLFTPFVFVYEKAIIEVGVPSSKASLILSLLGIFNTIGRLIAGYLADRPWADSLVIYNVSAILAGLLTCLVSVIFSFELLCVYAALFGILIGSYHTSIQLSKTNSSAMAGTARRMLQWVTLRLNFRLKGYERPPTTVVVRKLELLHFRMESKSPQCLV